MCLANGPDDAPALNRFDIQASLACPQCGKTVMVLPAGGGVVVMCTACQKGTSIVPIAVAAEKWAEVCKQFFS